MKVWSKIQLTDQNREVELISKSLTNYLYSYGPIADIIRKYNINDKDQKQLSQFMSNKIAGLLMLYLAKDTKRINDILNKYHIPDRNYGSLIPEVEVYLNK